MAKFLSDSGLLTLILKIKEEFDSIYETIIDDEKVTASALIDINTKYNNINNAIDTIEDTIDNLASVATSGSYNDLSNKPSIPTLVKSDWNETNSSSYAYIQNKPKIYNVDVGNPNSFATRIVGLMSECIDIGGNIIITNTQVDNINFAKIELGNTGGDDTITLTSNGSEGGVYVYTDTNKFYYNNKEVATKIPIVSHGTSDTTFTLTPNVYHIWGEVSTLTLTLGAGESGYLSEYMFEFQSGNTPTTLTLPNTVEWPSTPTIESNKRYQVSIVSNIALIVGV